MGYLKCEYLATDRVYEIGHVSEMLKIREQHARTVTLLKRVFGSENPLGTLNEMTAELRIPLPYCEMSNACTRLKEDEEADPVKNPRVVLAPQHAALIAEEYRKWT
jgi:hypothetical protein